VGQWKQTEASEDGAFTIPKVTPGRYRVSAPGYLAYVKSIRLGETASEGPVVNLCQGWGGAAVKVTLSSAFGEIAGTVQDDKGPASVFDVPVKVFADGVHNRMGIRTPPRTSARRTSRP